MKISFNLGPGSVELSTDMIALLKALASLRRESPVATVGQRFLQVFIEHGVKPSQIPRLLSSVNLSSLASAEGLLAALTPAVLDETAALWGIKSEWLEGVTDQIYPLHFCYKKPQAFFKQLESLPKDLASFPVRAFTCVDHLDYRDGSEQSIALVMVEELEQAKDLGELESVARYHILGDGWDWGYRPARIQLKAMVRLVDREIVRQPVPLYRVKRNELIAIREGRMIPRGLFICSPLTEPSLEDYACSESEHGRAKETDELPLVIEYIERLRKPEST